MTLILGFFSYAVPCRDGIRGIRVSLSCQIRVFLLVGEDGGDVSRRRLEPQEQSVRNSILYTSGYVLLSPSGLPPKLYLLIPIIQHLLFPESVIAVPCNAVMQSTKGISELDRMSRPGNPACDSMCKITFRIIIFFRIRRETWIRRPCWNGPTRLLAEPPPRSAARLCICILEILFLSSIPT